MPLTGIYLREIVMVENVDLCIWTTQSCLSKTEIQAFNSGDVFKLHEQTLEQVTLHM